MFERFTAVIFKLAMGLSTVKTAAPFLEGGRKYHRMEEESMLKNQQQSLETTLLVDNFNKSYKIILSWLLTWAGRHVNRLWWLSYVPFSGFQHIHKVSWPLLPSKFKNISLPPKENPRSSSSPSPFLLVQPLAATNLLPVCVDLPVLDI